MKKSARAVLPFAILGGAFLVIVALNVFKSVPPPVVRPDFAPLVVTEVATPQAFQFVVRAHGSVSPRSESDLIPQVSGEVVAMSDALAAGGFFEEGEVLVRIERIDYEASLETARASLARADSEHSRAKKERNRQRTLADRSVASQARIDDAETAYRVAFASLREARARLGQAERDLDRTEIRAPYAGRVRSESVDAGQFVQRGSPIAKLYAIDFAEVRLPLPDRELAFLDLPLVPDAARRRAKPLAPLDIEGVEAEGADAAPEAPELVVAPESPELHPLPSVVLHAEFAGRSHTWNGAIVRTEGEIDAQSRMVHVVAQVRDPYGVDPSNAGAPPLAVGLFVEAEILGRTVSEAYVLPRIALRGDAVNAQVYVVDSEGLLHFRDVEVLRVERETFIVGAGLSPGDRVCVSALAAAVEGMSVRERPEVASGAGVTP
jgi:RND family efflux transporter MFP subunit